MKRLCPICLAENTGGLPHRWHKMGARKKGRTQDELAAAARAVIEHNAVTAIVRDAVDEARYPDHWRSKPKTRAEYHREYYWRKIEKRRATARESRKRARLTKKLRPLILDLCRAVDLARVTASW